VKHGECDASVPKGHAEDWELPQTWEAARAAAVGQIAGRDAAVTKANADQSVGGGCGCNSGSSDIGFGG